jgi:hypothetical protein
LKRSGRVGYEVSDVPAPLTRDDVLEAIRRIMDTSFTRIDNRYIKNQEKLGWARVVVGAAGAAASLLRDEDLDELRARLDALEEVKKDE